MTMSHKQTHKSEAQGRVSIRQTVGAVSMAELEREHRRCEGGGEAESREGRDVREARGGM